MLTTLSIKNYALIAQLEIDFSPGFSVITGETGAGKSIILGALSLILGQRADSRTIRQGESKCVIEAAFNISDYPLQQFFETNDLDYDPVQCVIRREISDNGKSRSFINDTPVGLELLRELGSSLIDIHSQHQNLLLKDNRWQLSILDTLAANASLLDTYSDAFKAYNDTVKRLNRLKDKAAADSDEKEYIRFQFNQLAEANLSPGEQQAIESELNTLSNIEEIKSGLYRMETCLSNDQSGIIAELKNALNAALSLAKVYDKAQPLAERLESNYIDLKDILAEVSAEQEKLELDPERLNLISQRLDLIYSFQKKHKLDTVEALLELQGQLELKLNEIENYDQKIERLEAELEDRFKQVTALANKLSETRMKAASSILKTRLVETVSTLGIPNMQFDTLFTQKEEPGATGIDHVEFLFSANKNTELRPVAQIASGGEISRLMLGIKALIAGAKTLPTIIFDEIDTGISGETADKTAAIMRAMAKQMQVIVITHLPQMAAKADSHYYAYKDETSQATETKLRLLTPDQRIDEIAHLLSGSELTDAAISNAKELLKQK